MKVKFTTSARRQFLEGLEYIRQDNPMAAHQFRKEAEIVLSRLSEYPESDRVIPEFPELPHREVIVRPYRFFYRVVDKTVWVVAVWLHQRHDKSARGLTLTLAARKTNDF